MRPSRPEHLQCMQQLSILGAHLVRVKNLEAPSHLEGPLKEVGIVRNLAVSAGGGPSFVLLQEGRSTR